MNLLGGLFQMAKQQQLSSAERRVTVNAAVYPKLKEWAERDGLNVAAVANAILTQVIQPYQNGGVVYSAMPAAPVQRQQQSAGYAAEDYSGSGW